MQSDDIISNNLSHVCDLDFTSVIHASKDPSPSCLTNYNNSFPSWLYK